MITVEMIMDLLDKNMIRVWQEPNDDSAKCQIGEYWFYFYHIEDNDCLENWATDELAEVILRCINDADGNGLGDDEAEYYKSWILEMK